MAEDNKQTNEQLNDEPKQADQNASERKTERRSSSRGFEVGDEVQYEGVDLNGESGTFTGRVTDVSDSGIGVSQPNGSTRYYKSDQLSK